MVQIYREHRTYHKWQVVTLSLDLADMTVVLDQATPQDLMEEALRANSMAHQLEAQGQKGTRYYDIKNRALLRLYFEYGELMVVTPKGNQVSFILAGTGSCHSKKEELRVLISSNGYPAGIRTALYQAFGISPSSSPKTRSEGQRCRSHRKNGRIVI